MDIALTTSTDKDGFIEFSIAEGAGAVTGNKAMSQRFAITLLSSTFTRLSYGYGGDIMSGVTVASSSGLDTSSMAASVKNACVQTVSNMKATQAKLPATEQIQSASVESIDKVGDRVYVSIKLIPVEMDPGQGQGPLVTLPL